MTIWFKTDTDGRICAATENAEYADETMRELEDPPDGWDILHAHEWVWHDDTGLEHDPPDPEPDPEPDPDLERRAQIETAVPMLLAAMAPTMSDTKCLTVPLLFADWDATASYTEGDVARYAGELWRCRQTHDAQATWTPDQAHSLWARIVPPDTVEEWRQPQPGIFDGYTLGQKVTHDGHTWESTYDGLNVWEPGATGTENLWKQIPTTEDA